MSYSREIFDRYNSRKNIRRICGIALLLSGSIYLLWRLSTFNPDAYVLSIIFFGAELIAFVITLMTVFLSSSYNHRDPIKVPENLIVDVFILAYKEPLQIIERTISAAVDISYPHRTILLDDGNRPELRNLAQQLGCDYLARTDNRHAKAGNINNGLANSNSEFFAVFDADHVPLSNSLDKLLGFFCDKQVAFVQAPQEYYNIDCFQFANAKKGKALWHDQSFFYNISMACRDSHNAATCVGTGVVYRRSAIDQIGGIPVDTVTEDLHTSLKLHKEGFKSVFINEPVAFGVGSADLREYYKTRLRWGHGNIHALRIENVLTCGGLTFKQRLSYLSLGFIHLEGWQYLLLYLIPVISLMTGFAPFEITLVNILVVTGYPLLSYFLLQEFSCGFGRYWVNELFGMIRFPIYIMATGAFFRDGLAWQTSVKRFSGRVEWNLMLPQLTVLVLSVLGLAIAAFKIANSFELGPISSSMATMFTVGIEHLPAGVIPKELNWSETQQSGFSIDLLLMAGIWSLANIARSLIFIWWVFSSRIGNNEYYQFSIPLIAAIEDSEGPGQLQILCASEDEIGVDISDGDLVSWLPALASRIYVPGATLDVGLHPCESALDTQPNVKKFRIEWHSAEDRKTFSRALYSCDWQRELFYESGGFLTPLMFLARLFRTSRAPSRKPNWLPVLLTRNSCMSAQELAYIGSDRLTNNVVQLAYFGNPINQKDTIVCKNPSGVLQKCSIQIIKRSTGSSGRIKQVTDRVKIDYIDEDSIIYPLECNEKVTENSN